jgi:hypothetical protein
MQKIIYMFALLGALVTSFGCNGTNSKTEYALLQSIEYENRTAKISNAVIKEYNNHWVAGFRADNKKENVWVLLDSAYSPFYKQIPQSPFSLTTAELNQIKSIKSVSDTVIAVLETRLSN